MIRLRLFAVAAIPFLAASSLAQNIRRLDGTTISASDAANFADQTLQANHVTGAQLAVINRGQIVWTHAFGHRNTEQNLTMTTDTVTWAASITKSVFATFVMKLVEQHQFDLDRPIALDLPNLPTLSDRYSALTSDDRWKLITPRMLLSHTSGFANLYFLEPDSKLHIHWQPGTRYGYSGEGLNLLQLVIETRTKQKLEDMMQQQIFQPLGMAHTSLIWQDSFAGNVALNYDPDGKTPGHSHRQSARAAGSMDTTLSDLLRFTTALLSNRILSVTTTKQMLKPQIAIHTLHQFPTLIESRGKEADAIGLSYGIGWGLLTHTEYGPAFFKEGHGDGAQNYMICFQRSQSCMIILANSENGEFAFRALLEHIFGDTVTPWEWESYTPEQIQYSRQHQ